MPEAARPTKAPSLSLHPLMFCWFASKQSWDYCPFPKPYRILDRNYHCGFFLVKVHIHILSSLRTSLGMFRPAHSKESSLPLGPKGSPLVGSCLLLNTLTLFLLPLPYTNLDRDFGSLPHRNTFSTEGTLDPAVQHLSTVK